MAQNLWQAGAVDNVFAPYDWSNGAPQPGDTLVIGSGMAFLGDSDIYGNTVVLSGEASQATLIAYGSANVSVQVAYNSAVPGPGNGGSAPSGTIEVVGAPHVSLSVIGSQQIDSNATVAIDAYSQMRGGFTGTGSNAAVTIDGTGTSTFANSLSSLTGIFEVATVNANVVGDGTFDIGLFDAMRFTSGVSSGQTINDNGGSLTIGDTPGFRGSVDWTPTATSNGSNDHIALSGLMADHSSYANGVLSLTSGGADVFDLHLRTNPSSDVVAAQASNGIDVYASATAAEAAGATIIAHA